MELFDTTQLGLERALAGASRRQAAIAENLANVNTPGYQRKDVDFHSALQQAFAAGRDAVARVEPVARVDAAAPMRADGNSVDLDAEAAAQAQTGLEYEALAAVIKARSEIVLSAAGVR
jgi:flagellar basal-body rod protein FlgB